MENYEELLVAIINNISDFEIARDKHWYRIPKTSVNKFLNKRWPPKWIAFYFSGRIKKYPFMIKYFAQVTSINLVSRKTLLPYEQTDTKANKKYFKISFNKLLELPKPIISRKWRRIVFIQTTLNKFQIAVEINDLYDGSPLEDRLWAELKRNEIEAQRQELVQIDNNFYFLDFAVYCRNGKLDLETDGDRWHHDPVKAEQDNIRDNALSTIGWNIMRFNSTQIHEQINTYCVPKIKSKINNLGGVVINETFSKRFYQIPSAPSQFDLFEIMD